MTAVGRFGRALFTLCVVGSGACSPETNQTGRARTSEESEALIGGNWTLAKFVPPGFTAPRYGSGIAIEGDTALVAAPGDGDENAWIGSGAVYVLTRAGGTWAVQQKLVPTDPSDDDRFAVSLALSGDTAVVGSHGPPGLGTKSCWLHVFVRSGSTWSEQVSLHAGEHEGLPAVAVSGDTAMIGIWGLPSTVRSGHVEVFVRSGSTWSLTQSIAGGEDSTFGTTLALSGDTALIGATSSALGGGRVHVYLRSGSTWSDEQVLAPTSTSGDAFGSTVALEGDTAVIGAPGRDLGGTDSGAAYVFVRAGSVWSQQQRLDGRRAFSWFGGDVSISGDRLVVGANGSIWGAEAYAGAYVYERAGNVWTNPVRLGRFAARVAVSGNTIFVGMPNEVESGKSGVPGAAYAYEGSGSTWSAPQRFAPEVETADPRHFGRSIARSGDTVLVGEEGAAYVFVRGATGWELQQKLVGNGPSNPPPIVPFGASVALSGDTAVVGSPDDDSGAGAAYVYDRAGDSWTLSQRLTGVYNPHPGDEFGRSVSISGNSILVGTPGSFPSVFVRSGEMWVRQQVLFAESSGNVGSNVAISGDRALVSEATSYTTGSVLVFVRNGDSWSLEARLIGEFACAFGTSLALSGNLAAVGTNCGKAFLFERTGSVWRRTGFEGWEDELNDFGSCVAAGDQLALVGAPESNRVHELTRSRSEWVSGPALAASYDRINRHFGSSLAFQGGELAIGSDTDYQRGEDSGAAYVLSCAGFACPKPCETAADCSPSSRCTQAGTCRDPGLRGSLCETDTDCADSVCSAGMCCNTRCEGVCESCRAIDKASGADGTCGPVEGGLDPFDSCEADTSNTCGEDGTCDGVRHCRVRPEGSACGCSGSRRSGFEAEEGSCNGEGQCRAQNRTSCGSYACEDGECRSNCRTDDDCVQETVCRSGRCLPDDSGDGGAGGAPGGEGGSSVGGRSGSSGSAGTSNGGASARDGGVSAGDGGDPTGDGGASTGGGRASTGGSAASMGDGGASAGNGGASMGGEPPSAIEQGMPADASDCDCSVPGRSRRDPRLELLFAGLVTATLARRRRVTASETTRAR